MKSINRYILGIVCAAFLLMLPLSPAHACTSPVGVAGDVLFGDDNNVPAYCDGTNWIAMTGGELGDSYTPNAVYFDGSTDVGSSSTSFTSTDAKEVTVSFWVKRTPASGFCNIFHNDLVGGGLQGLDIGYSNDDRFYFTAQNAAETNIMYNWDTTTYATGQWHHVVFSIDLTDSGRRHFYINDTDRTTAETHTDDFIPFNTPRYRIGSREGVDRYCDGEIADFWMDHGTYIDLSVEANRRKFIDSNGNPVNLGSDGSNPTGSAPEIFLSGDTATWHTNDGTGGGFAENGALTTGNFSNPYESTQIVPSGLVGHWRLDETAGTTAFDSSGNGFDGTWFEIGTDDLSDNTVDGVVDSAIAFDIAGDDGHFDMGSDASLQITGDVTIAGWVNFDEFSFGTPMLIYAGASETSSDNVLYALMFDSSAQVQFLHEHGSGSNELMTVDPGLVTNRWYHIAAVRDDGAQTINFYIDGEFFGSDTYTNSAFDGSAGRLEVGRNIGNTASILSGYMDDIRLYNRALEADEITELYNARDGIRYNNAQRTMEFFDGNQWVSMTPEWIEPGVTSQSSCTPSVMDFVPTEINAAQTTYTASNYSFTNTGNGQVLVVTTASESAEDVTGVTFNGVALTEAVDTNITISSSGASIFYLPDPPNVTADIVVTYGSTPSNRAGIGAMILDCVDTTTAPITTSTTGTATTLSNSITTVTANTLIIDALTSEDNGSVSATTESGQTALVAENLGTGTEWGISWKLEATPGSSTMGWSGLTNTTESALAIAGFAPDTSNTIKTAPSLIAHWRFDETEGTTATDATGNGNDGTWANGSNVRSTRGIIGNAFQFSSASEDYVEILNFDPPHQGTVSLWINTNSSAFNRILGGDNAYEITETGGNRFANDFFESGSGLLSTITVSNGQWYHLAMTYDFNTNATQLYIDGALDNSGSNATDDPGGPFTLRLGHRTGASNTEHFEGVLDDIRIYDRVLTNDEITQLYQMGAHVGSSTALPVGCPNPGDICDDGSIYVGDSPDGTIPMFAAGTDAEDVPWNNGNSTGTVSTSGSVSGNVDGDGHTNTLVTIDSDSITAGHQPHQAAQVCYDLNQHGADDWYLPARDELSLIHTHIGSTDALRAQYGISSGFYWGSRETSATAGIRVTMSDGSTGGRVKHNNSNVRCVRKGPAPRCANPYGMEGDVVYNTTHTVLQYCDGARWRAIGK